MTAVQVLVKYIFDPIALIIYLSYPLLLWIPFQKTYFLI